MSYRNIAKAKLVEKKSYAGQKIGIKDVGCVEEILTTPLRGRRNAKC